MPRILVDAKTTFDPATDSAQIAAFFTGLATATEASTIVTRLKFNGSELDCTGGYFTRADRFTHQGVEVKFDQSVFFKKQPGMDDGYRCFFVGRNLGKGTFATVRKVDAVVDVTPTSYLPYGGYAQPKVIRMQNHCKCADKHGRSCGAHNTIEMLEQEYSISSKVPHLGIKEPPGLVARTAKETTKITSCTVMDKLEGVELFHVLQRDINKEERLTVEQRIQLALALYKGLKAQVSDLRIIHRDLKPENIMVDLEKMEVRFFDYGFAITLPVGRKEIEVSNFCGTATYVSPETLVGSKISFATDLYSLTRVLILLWGGVDESFIKDNPEPISLIKERHKLRFLFKDLSKEQQTELSKSDIRNDIKVLLARGLDVDQYKRGTVEDAIGEFERIFEKYNQRLTRQPRKAIEVKPEFGRAAKACAALGGPTPDKTSMRPSSSDKRGDSMFTLLNGLFFNPPTAAPPSFKEAPSDEGSEEKCLYYG